MRVHLHFNIVNIQPGCDISVLNFSRKKSLFIPRLIVRNSSSSLLWGMDSFPQFASTKRTPKSSVSFLLPGLQCTQMMEDVGSVEHQTTRNFSYAPISFHCKQENPVVGPCFHIILMGREKGIIFPQDTEVVSLI